MTGHGYIIDGTGQALALEVSQTRPVNALAATSLASIHDMSRQASPNGSSEALLYRVAHEYSRGFSEQGTVSGTEICFSVPSAEGRRGR
jgi:hypothetical protein